MSSNRYSSIILVGDRVALAPHLDLWMVGIRFGTVERISTASHGGRIRHLFYVKCDDSRVHCFSGEDLLGSVMKDLLGSVMKDADAEV